MISSIVIKICLSKMKANIKMLNSDILIDNIIFGGSSFSCANSMSLIILKIY